LLTFRRTELAAYLHDLQQPFRTDATNRDVRFTRNRIRRELLPLLAAHSNRSIVPALLRLGDLAGESQSFLDAIVQDAAEQCVRRLGDDDVCIDLGILAAQPRHLLREVLLHVWRGQDWPLAAMGFAEWNTLSNMILLSAQPPSGEPAKRMFPGAVLAEIGGGELRLTKVAY